MSIARVKTSYDSDLYADLLESNFDVATSVTRTSSALTVYFGSSSVYGQFKGKNLTYDNQGLPSGGQFTGFKVAYYGEIVEVNGFSVSATQLFKWALSDNDAAIEKAIFGSADKVYGNSGNDFLESGAGNDLIFGKAGDDTLDGGSGNDKLNGDSGNDTLYGESGNDQLNGGTGNDSMYGGKGNDIYFVDSSSDNVTEYSGQGNDQVKSYLSDYTLGSNIENGRIMSTGAADLTGNILDNILYAGKGDNDLDGGSGTDTVSYLYGATDGVTVDLAITIAQDTIGSGTDTLTSIERLHGSNYNDTLYGTSGSDYLRGHDGNDILDGGGSGNNTLIGDAGNDTLIGGTGDDTFNGGSGSDTVSYYDIASSGILIDLSKSSSQSTTGGSGTDTLISIERLYATDFDDTLYGNDKANILRGYDGNDILDGRGGNDTMRGDDGDDVYRVRDSGDVVQEFSGEGTDFVYSHISNYTLGDHVEDGRIMSGGSANLKGNSLDNFIYAGKGSNIINAGGGDDTVSYLYGAKSGVTVKLDTSLAQNTKGSGTDRLKSVENLHGSNFNDKLYGNDQANTLRGHDGNDLLDGRAGADTLRGDDGNDTYQVRDVGDVVEEYSGEGIDHVNSFLSSYTLTDHVENGRIKSQGAADLTGNALDNEIQAGLGDNVMDGGSGTDTVSYLYGASSGVTVDLSVSTAQNTGGSGTDTLTSIENLHGSNYNDTLKGTATDNYLRGYEGNDTLDGGGSGNNTLIGDAGKDFLISGSDDDVLNGGSGTDSVSFYDSATSGVTVDLAVTSAQATGGSGTDTLISIERLYATDFDDTLYGNDKTNILRGYDGNDILDGRGGNDTMRGDDGDDVYRVRDSGDVVQEFSGEGTDFVYSHISNYTLGDYVEDGRIMSGGSANLKGNSLDNFIYAGKGSNIINAGGGDDTVSYLYGAKSGVTVKLDTSLAQNTKGSGTDRLKSVENLHGSNFNDKLYGNDQANTLRGHDGNDLLDGRAGADTLRGDDGNDTYQVRDVGDVVEEYSGEGIDHVNSFLSSYTLTDHVENGRIRSQGAADLTGNALDNEIQAGLGDNVMDGGSGTDTVSYLYGASSGVTVDLSVSTAQNTGGSGTDTLTSIENLHGSNYNDTLSGTSGADYLKGNGGKDTLSAGDGNDILIGDAGSDILFGGNGADQLEGGDGKDLYMFSQGESPEITYDGVDTFTALNGLDVISDFTLGDDSIDLSSLDFTNAFDGTTQDQNVSVVDGDWDGSEFVVSNSGSDALVVYDGDDSASANFTGVVLSDVDASLLQIVSSDDGITIS